MYIDPNTGGALFQALAAVLVMFSGFFLVFSGRIKDRIARFRRSARGEDSVDYQVSEVSETEVPRDDESRY